MALRGPSRRLIRHALRGSEIANIWGSFCSIGYRNNKYPFAVAHATLHFLGFSVAKGRRVLPRVVVAELQNAQPVSLILDQKTILGSFNTVVENRSHIPKSNHKPVTKAKGCNRKISPISRHGIPRFDEMRLFFRTMNYWTIILEPKPNFSY